MGTTRQVEMSAWMKAYETVGLKIGRLMGKIWSRQGIVGEGTSPLKGEDHQKGIAHRKEESPFVLDKGPKVRGWKKKFPTWDPPPTK